MACKEIMEYIRRVQERLISNDPSSIMECKGTSTSSIRTTYLGATNTTLRSLYKTSRESQKTSKTMEALVEVEEESN